MAGAKPDDARAAVAVVNDSKFFIEAAQLRFNIWQVCCAAAMYSINPVEVHFDDRRLKRKVAHRADHSYIILHHFNFPRAHAAFLSAVSSKVFSPCASLPRNFSNLRFLKLSFTASFATRVSALRFSAELSFFNCAADGSGVSNSARYRLSAIEAILFVARQRFTGRPAVPAPFSSRVTIAKPFSNKSCSAWARSTAERPPANRLLISVPVIPTSLASRSAFKITSASLCPVASLKMK